MFEALILAQLTLDPNNRDPYRDWKQDADSYYLEQQQRRDRQRLDDLDYRVQDLEQQKRFNPADQILRDYFKRR